MADFSYTGIYNLFGAEWAGFRRYRCGTHNNVDGTEFVYGELEETDLVVPIQDVSFLEYGRPNAIQLEESRASK